MNARVTKFTSLLGTHTRRPGLFFVWRIQSHPKHFFAAGVKGHGRTQRTSAFVPINNDHHCLFRLLRSYFLSIVGEKIQLVFFYCCCCVYLSLVMRWNLLLCCIPMVLTLPPVVGAALMRDGKLLLVFGRRKLRMPRWKMTTNFFVFFIN